MIEQLAEHGVTAEDLTPSLATTHTVDNPEYDPDFTPDVPDTESFTPPPPEPTTPIPDSPAPLEVPPEVPKLDMSFADAVKSEPAAPAETEFERLEREAIEREEDALGLVRREVAKIERRASQQGDDPLSSPRSRASPRKKRFPSGTFGPIDPFSDGGDISRHSDELPKARPMLVDPFADEGGDIGGALDVPARVDEHDATTPTNSTFPLPPEADLAAEVVTPHAPSTALPTPLSPPAAPPEPEPETPTTPHSPSNLLTPMPSSLPGVSKTLTAADKTVTLDIRWTILCDLFLSLIADSVYDARSRVLLGKVAEKLGLEWMDVVRFERRLTEALEIQESVATKEHQDVLDGQRKKGMRQRYVMMGLATLGRSHFQRFWCAPLTVACVQVED